ncbi:hypothetical protein PP7435_CHR3-0314 [Komagataella phaffii CBS 7435]|uniref:MHD domain-containing protein n=1 Tax=Komagataella phaffii (strain ATCC 76273 / CBS 7435 / CECT 11047 / NRRL Y-11430 / Wegner 21-1) TaxID=981350 RepID=F2QV56_KOMPC|nr:GQ67_03980T0 [Komagataella phaffii]AOA68256.1 GQ68_03953T0 [Komagataella phaffii GS115]CAH2449270.1 hypothetical protein BQ9382_C3-1725 [Komagataella phaffii CBS 7435]CCA39284.1 hypothetical protein PP7435_CHR3-0314 [Komagataella phaffii CBS 7435]
MSEERTNYSSTILVSKPPKEAIECLVLRHTQVTNINKDLAQWLSDYHKIKKQFANSLNSLLARGNGLFEKRNDVYHNDLVNAMGLLHPLWMSVYSEVGMEYKAAEGGCRRLLSEIVKPIRTFNQDFDSSLDSLNTLEDLASNIDELNSSKKLKESEKERLNELNDEWSSKAPYLFEIFESYDYNRLIMLKDAFTNFETNVQDNIQLYQKQNEQGLQLTLNFNPDDEISRFSTDACSKEILLSSKKRKDSKTAVDHTDVESQGTHKTSRSSKLLGKLGSHNQDHHSISSGREATSAPQTAPVPSAEPLGFNGKFTSKSAKEPSSKNHKLRSKVGSIFGRKKKSKNPNPDMGTIAESTSSSFVSNNRSESSVNVGRRTATREQTHLSREVTLNDKGAGEQSFEAKQERPSSIQNSLENNVAAPKSEIKQLGIQPQIPKTAQDNYVSSVETSSPGSPIKLQQSSPQYEKPSSLYSFEPLQPKKQQQNAQPPQQEQQQQQKENAAQLSYGVAQPPAPPTSRHTYTSESALNPPRSSHGAVPPPPVPRNNQRVQSHLFHDLPQARQPSFASTVATNNEDVSSVRIGGAGIAVQNTGSSSIKPNLTGTSAGSPFQHPSLRAPGLNASIAEVINASFKDGVKTRSSIVGEVAFSYITDPANNTLPSNINFTLQNSKKQADKYLLNNDILRQHAENSFTLTDVQQIQFQTLGAVKYLLNDVAAPIVVIPTWKFEEHQASVIISVRLSPELLATLPEDFKGLTLSNFSLSVSIKGAQATSAATKPQGSFNKEKNRIAWTFPNPITLTATNEERLIARFMTSGLAQEADTGCLVKFVINDDFGTRLVDSGFTLQYQEVTNDPFSSSDNVSSGEWKPVHELKTLVAGTYSGSA